MNGPELPIFPIAVLTYGDRSLAVLAIMYCGVELLTINMCVCVCVCVFVCVCVCVV